MGVTERGTGNYFMLHFEKNLRFRFCYENTTRISSQEVVVPRKIGSVTTSLILCVQIEDMIRMFCGH